MSHNSRFKRIREALSSEGQEKQIQALKSGSTAADRKPEVTIDEDFVEDRPDAAVHIWGTSVGSNMYMSLENARLLSKLLDKELKKVGV